MHSCNSPACSLITCFVLLFKVSACHSVNAEALRGAAGFILGPNKQAGRLITAIYHHGEACLHSTALLCHWGPHSSIRTKAVAFHHEVTLRTWVSVTFTFNVIKPIWFPRSLLMLPVNVSYNFIMALKEKCLLHLERNAAQNVNGGKQSLNKIRYSIVNYWILIIAIHLLLLPHATRLEYEYVS